MVATKGFIFPSISVLFFSCFLLLGGAVPAYGQIIPEPQTENQEETLPEFPEDTLGRRTPRGTVNGYIRAVANQNYTRASHFLNLPENLPDEQAEGERLVQALQRLLDQGGRFMPYSWISDQTTGRTDDNLPAGIDRVGSVSAEGESIDLLVEETKGPEDGPIWLFSSETIEKIAAVSTPGVLPVEKILPRFLDRWAWKGASIGQWLFAILLLALAYLVSWCIVWIVKYLIGRLWQKSRTEPTEGIIQAFALPIRLYLAVWLYVVLSQQIGISILVRQRLSGITLIAGLVAVLILLWRLTDYISIFSRRQMSLRGQLSWVSIVLFLRRLAKFAIVVFGGIAVLGALGVNVTTGLAALGIGGIALALGAQKTVENFVGSVTLVTDQPVRVGDFCKVGNTVGTVEKIGMRSTRIRTVERTLITIPNGALASSDIENYAARDRFLFQTKLGLRCETTPDQLRFLLVELRSILYAHPVVDPSPARIRFISLGDFSLDLEVFAYINAADFDEYMEVKEDLLLKMMDKVAESGTDFAFPSQTLYLAKDQGVSSEKSRDVEEVVKKWRENKEMQIPKFHPDRIHKVRNTSPYPPKGSAIRKDKDES